MSKDSNGLTIHDYYIGQRVWVRYKKQIMAGSIQQFHSTGGEPKVTIALDYGENIKVGISIVQPNFDKESSLMNCKIAPV